MKKPLFAFLLALLPLVASAQVEIEFGGVYYDLSVGSTEERLAQVVRLADKDYSGHIGIATQLAYNDEAYIVTTLGSYCFSDCTGLTSVSIPNSVTTINSCAFQGCTGLTSITIPNSVTHIEASAFSGCSSLTSIEIPSSVTSLQSYIFEGCSSLQSVTISNPITTRIDGLFYGCSSLTSVNIPNGTTIIGFHTFNGCSSLKTVTIPSSVTSIYGNAFANCTELSVVYCYAAVVPETDDGVFDMSHPESATLYVPASSVDAYKAAEPWNQFKEILPIEEVHSDEDVITIKDTGKGTWCSEYDLDFTDVEGIKAYTATGYDDDSKTIWLSRVYRVPAGTGIMVKGDPGEYKIPHATVKAAYANMFKGNTGPEITIYETDGEWTNYYMSKGQFVSVSGNAKIAKNRCYLQLPTSVFAGTRSIEIVYDDEEEGTTGIMDNGPLDPEGRLLPEGTQEWIMDNSSDQWYTISGQRISQPTKKGLYIHHGRKVIIR